MPIVRMEDIGETTSEDGRRLVLAIEDAGVDILHRCGGNARCATCRVEILEGDPGPHTDFELTRLDAIQDRLETTRLSCQVQVHDDLTVRVVRRLRDFPEMADPGPRPIEWPSDHPLPPD